MATTVADEGVEDEQDHIEQLLLDSYHMSRVFIDGQFGYPSEEAQSHALDGMCNTLQTLINREFPCTGVCLVEDGKYDIMVIYGILRCRSSAEDVKVKAMRLLALVIGTDVWDELDDVTFDDNFITDVIPLVVLYLWSGSDALKAQAAHFVKRLAVKVANPHICRNSSVTREFADLNVVKALITIIGCNENQTTRMHAASALLNLLKTQDSSFSKSILNIPNGVQTLVSASGPSTGPERHLHHLLTDLLTLWRSQDQESRDAIDAELASRTPQPAPRPSFASVSEREITPTPTPASVHPALRAVSDELFEVREQLPDGVYQRLENRLKRSHELMAADGDDAGTEAAA